VTNTCGRSNPGNDRIAGLLTRSGNGDEAAFADLYDRTSPMVYSMALRVLCSQAHAEEVTQEVYLQVWQQAARYDRSRGTVLGWMKMLAHRRAIDRVRAVHTANIRDHDVAQLNATRRPDDYCDEVAARIDAMRIHHALAQLTAVQREAVTLRYFEERSMIQIASHLCLPLGTVKTRIRDGLTCLRRTEASAAIEQV
jgi:RNA polymerase sigma-70 factor (ECF subfamily)